MTDPRPAPRPCGACRELVYSCQHWHPATTARRRSRREIARANATRVLREQTALLRALGADVPPLGPGGRPRKDPS